MTDEKYFRESTFEESDFKKGDFAANLLRFWRQFISLSIKNFLIFKQRPFQLALIILIPSFVIAIFYLGNNGLIYSSSSQSQFKLPSPLSGLGNCEAYSSAACIQLTYAPSSEPFRSIMKQVAEMNHLDFETDVLGFDNAGFLKVTQIVFHYALFLQFIHTLIELCFEQSWCRSVQYIFYQ